jgi:TolB-like protein/Flp pilus assembly protein TadD
MHPAEASDGSVRSELEKILASPEFLRNERLSKFFRFVVEQQLAGKAAELKESLVGIEVFGRTPGFDPRQDSVVRTEAAKLRARLSKYYAGEGAVDPVVIELPKGGYTPVFRQPDAARERTTAGRNSVVSRLGKRGWLMITLASLALLLAVSGWRWVTQKSSLIAIAVLPLKNLSEDPANDYFADGLTHEIIRNLSIIEGLTVRSQTSSFSFKGQPRNIREAGKQLDAEYILEGSVLRSGQQLRINVLLVRVRDDLPLWSGKFDRELMDVFAIQDEISRGIVNGLRLNLGRGRRRYETSVEAYDLYLRARQHQPPLAEGGLGQGIKLFEQAIAKDPSFAPAYAGLAALHATRSGYFRSDHSDEATKMQAAAEKAIQLDPLLAEAHDALGMAQARAAQWKQSERSFRRAIEIEPGRSISRQHFAMFLLLPLGTIEEALQEARAAAKTDPLSPAVQYSLTYVLFAAGRHEEAAGHCEKVLPHLKSECLARVLLGRGRIGEAIQILDADVDRSVIAFGVLGYAYARAGRTDEAEKLASDWQRDPIVHAMTFAGLGDKERTLEALTRMAPLGAFRIGRALAFPEFALLRGDPRVNALRKKVGLPE